MTYMATKTISIDLQAYERLRNARLTPDESFSKVIKRAVWPPAPRTAAAMLAALEVCRSCRKPVSYASMQHSSQTRHPRTHGGKGSARHDVSHRPAARAPTERRRRSGAPFPGDCP